MRLALLIAAGVVLLLCVYAAGYATAARRVQARMTSVVRLAARQANDSASSGAIDRIVDRAMADARRWRAEPSLADVVDPAHMDVDTDGSTGTPCSKEGGN